MVKAHDGLVHGQLYTNDSVMLVEVYELGLAYVHYNKKLVGVVEFKSNATDTVAFTYKNVEHTLTRIRKKH